MYGRSALVRAGEEVARQAMPGVRAAIADAVESYRLTSTDVRDLTGGEGAASLWVAREILATHAGFALARELAD